VTADLGGNIVAVSVRTVKLDEPGLAPELGDAGDVGSMSATTTRLDELSVYESELVVDFRDGRTRNELEAALGIDLTDRASQVRAALAVVQQAPTAVRAASVTVLERSAPNDQMWGVACSVPQILEVDLGVGHGQISQRTLAAAYKAPGEDQLRALAVPPGG
jgi:hypothetical protein